MRMVSASRSGSCRHARLGLARRPSTAACEHQRPFGLSHMRLLHSLWAPEEHMRVNVRSLLTAGATLTPEQEKAVFGSIRLRNGTYKMTTHHRLDDLNALVISEWRRLGQTPDNIMECGASSGISSLEWVDALTRAGIAADILATDLCMHASLVRLLPMYDVLLDRDGKVIQHIVGDRPVRVWYPNRPRDFLAVRGYVHTALNVV